MSRKSTWMVVEACEELQPPALSVTVQTIVVPGDAASKTICREPCQAVMTPSLERPQVQVEPMWLTTLADAPDAPTGTEIGAEITGIEGVMFTVTVVEAVLVETQPLAAVTVRCRSWWRRASRSACSSTHSKAPSPASTGTKRRPSR